MPKRKPKTNRVRRPGVPCPICSHGISEVLRVAARGQSLQRIRQCAGCRKRFTTSEQTKKSDTGITLDDTGIETLLKAIRTGIPANRTALNFPHEGRK